MAFYINIGIGWIILQSIFLAFGYNNKNINLKKYFLQVILFTISIKYFTKYYNSFNWFIDYRCLLLFDNIYALSPLIILYAILRLSTTTIDTKGRIIFGGLYFMYLAILTIRVLQYFISHDYHHVNKSNEISYLHLSGSAVLCLISTITLQYCINNLDKALINKSNVIRSILTYLVIISFIDILINVLWNVSRLNILPIGELVHEIRSVPMFFDILFLFSIQTVLSTTDQEFKEMEIQHLSPSEAIIQTTAPFINTVKNKYFSLDAILMKKIETRYSEQIIQKKAYLNPNLLESDIAKIFEVKNHHLKFYVNHKYNQSLKNHINYLRIEEAKTLLSNQKLNNQSIVDIGFQCGFNSESVFYSNFKKFTGNTPLEYKQLSIRK
ncbi:MAG: helix-turn-helix domain-containing protein [Bacteroidota bacterium]|nr:helix-turn-helix domain-containing protein [Bacteroidota bacterium]